MGRRNRIGSVFAVRVEDSEGESGSGGDGMEAGDDD
jgi:hypothetical protein